MVRSLVGSELCREAATPGGRGGVAGSPIYRIGPRVGAGFAARTHTQLACAARWIKRAGGGPPRLIKSRGGPPNIRSGEVLVCGRMTKTVAAVNSAGPRKPSVFNFGYYRVSPKGRVQLKLTYIDRLEPQSSVVLGKVEAAARHSDSARSKFYAYSLA